MDYIKAEQLSELKYIKTIKDAVLSDKVLIYPTDTLYGIGGNFLSSAAHEAVDNMKGRVNAPYSAAASGISQALSLCESPSALQAELMEALLPGKVTLLVEFNKDLSPNLTKGSPLIGIRIPDNPETIKIVEAATTPLITTSVNFTGQDSLNTPEDIMEKFIAPLGDRGPALMIESSYRFGESKGSTIIDISSSPGRIIRRGDEAGKTIETVNRISNWNIS